MNGQDQGVTNEVEKRLNDLFGDEEDGQSAFLENSSIIQNSPLMELKGVVLSLDWEITDEIMGSFLDEIKHLQKTYAGEKVPELFLQLLGSVGKYIRNNKARAHPDSIKVLNSVYNGFEKVLLDDTLSDVDKRNCLYNELNRFKKLKQEITHARIEEPAYLKEQEQHDKLHATLETMTKEIPSVSVSTTETERPHRDEDMVSVKEAFAQALEETVQVIKDEFKLLRAELQLWREERPKKYQIDAGGIKGKEARFKCKGCGHEVTVKVSRPSEDNNSALLEIEATNELPVEPVPAPPEKPAAKLFETEAPLTPEEPVTPSFEFKATPPPEEKQEKTRKEGKALVPKGIGLRTKMFFLFFLVPLLSLVAAGWLYVQQLTALSSSIADESSLLVNEMAENIIDLKARTVARQVATYLEANPGFHKTRFNNDTLFREIAVQPVGDTGYTALYELPDSGGVWRTWAHENPNIIGIDMEDLREPLGRAFPGFWKVFSGVMDGKKSQGYYTWKDVDGEFRDKFMVCTPVEGTRFIIAATTYMYEFTQPVQDLNVATEERFGATITKVVTIISATILLIGVIVALFGHRLTRRIQSLTDVTERISVGELDADVAPGANDEIGDLGNAVSRMQESIRISIERLRRRR